MTAPLLSPTDISPSFELDHDDWLQPRSPAASNMPDYSAFSAALSNHFSFAITAPPSGHVYSLPTRPLPYSGASETFPSFELTGNGSIPFGGIPRSAPSTNQEYGFDQGMFFDSCTEDLMIEQACFNSLMDISPDNQDPGTSLLEAPSENLQEHSDCTLSNDLPNWNDILAESLTLQPEPQSSLDTNVIFFPRQDNNSQCAINASSSVCCQSNHLTPSQWLRAGYEDPKDVVEMEYVSDRLNDIINEFVPSPTTYTGPSATALTLPTRPQEHLHAKAKSTGKTTAIGKKHNTFINSFATPKGTASAIQGPSPSKRGRRALDDQERRKAACIRKLGACIKCRKGRRSCLRNQCRFHELLMVNPITINLPCTFLKFEDVQLFRLAPSKEHPMRCSDEVYKSLELSRRQYDYLELQLSQGYGCELSIEVAQFDPQPGDKTAHTWHRGEVELPPYCIVGIEQAKQRMLEYARNSRDAIILKLQSGANDITREVFDQAIRYARDTQSSLVEQALDLFAGARIIESDWCICGSETLGIQVIVDPQSPLSGKIPVTPVMDGQLDQVITKAHLLPLREKFLASLQQTIYASKKEDWFAIFLSTFIYLAHIECLLQHSRRNAKRYGIKRRYNSISLAEEYFKASRIALAHFHLISNNSVPLQLDWKESKIATDAKLDSDQVEFMGSVLSKMEERKQDGSVRKMKAMHRYEEPLYFCHELFEQKWEPGKNGIVIHDEIV